MRRSTKELGRGILWIGLMLLMILGVISNILRDDVVGLVICLTGVAADAANIIMSFREYRDLRKWEDEYFRACMEKGYPEESDILFD